MVKLNDSFSGEGNAVLRIDEALRDVLKDCAAWLAILWKCDENAKYIYLNTNYNIVCA